MSFVEKTKTMGDLYLVPTKMQDFRLATGAPIFVDFKSIPYQDTDVLEWYRRVRLANRFYRNINKECELLEQLTVEDRITHIVIDTNEITDDCALSHQVYRDDNFSIYSVTGH